METEKKQSSEDYQAFRQGLGALSEKARVLTNHFYNHAFKKGTVLKVVEARDVIDKLIGIAERNDPGGLAMKEDCIFCRIAEKEADATVVYEDSHTLAFLDIHPLNPGHTLVIPKKHYTNLLDMPSEEATQIFASVHKIMKGVQQASAADGISVGQSNGRAAAQEVFHVHVHIIPRFNHEMMSGFPNRKETPRSKLDEIGRKIRVALEAKSPAALALAKA